MDSRLGLRIQEGEMEISGQDENVALVFFVPSPDGLPSPAIHFRTCKISISLPPVYLAFSSICVTDRLKKPDTRCLYFHFIYPLTNDEWMSICDL